MPLQIKRIYAPAKVCDGVRLLVDRLWPRGISKERAEIDGWAKELTPSSELRTWFGHKAENFDRFSVLYRAELDANPAAQAAAQKVVQQSQMGMVTLLYGAKDPNINHAIILKQYLEALEGDKPERTTR